MDRFTEVSEERFRVTPVIIGGLFLPRACERYPISVVFRTLANLTKVQLFIKSILSIFFIDTIYEIRTQGAPRCAAVRHSVLGSAHLRYLPSPVRTGRGLHRRPCEPGRDGCRHLGCEHHVSDLRRRPAANAKSTECKPFLSDPSAPAIMVETPKRGAGSSAVCLRRDGNSALGDHFAEISYESL